MMLQIHDFIVQRNGIERRKKLEDRYKTNATNMYMYTQTHVHTRMHAST